MRRESASLCAYRLVGMMRSSDRQRFHCPSATEFPAVERARTRPNRRGNTTASAAEVYRDGAMLQ